MFKYIKFIFKTLSTPILFCNVIYGRTGSGKSYYMAKLIRQKLFQGKNVNTTLEIDIEKLEKQFKRTFSYKFSKYILKKDLKMGHLWKINSLDDFLFIDNSTVFIDEGHRWFFSRDWDKLPKYITAKIFEHRKYKIDIFIAVQDVKTIDVILRRLGDNAIQIKSFFFIQLIRYYDIADIDKEKRKAKHIQLIFREPSVFEIFNSFEKNTDFNKIINEYNLTDTRKKVF